MDPSASSPMVFQFLFEQALTSIQAWSATTAHTSAMIIGPAATVMFGIYMLLWNYALAKGAISEPITDFYGRCMRGAMILMFATSVGIYNDWIASFMWQVPGAIAQEVVQAGSSGGLGNPNHSTAMMLDKALGAGIDAGFVSWEKMSFMKGVGASIGYAIIAFLIWVMVALVCAYAACLVLISNIGLAVMLGVGPIFIVLAMFESTQAYFQAWVKQVTTFAIFFIITGAIVSLTFSFFKPFIEGIAKQDAGELILSMVKIIVMCAATLLTLQQAQSWAAGLAGGVAITAQGAIGRAVGGASRAVMHAHYDPNKKNKDGTQGGHRFRGALPSTVNGGVAVGKRAAAYLKRNTVKKA